MNKTLKHLSITAAASALLLCGGALLSQQVQAAPASGVVHVRYNGKGKVRLLDANGRFVNQYVSRNSAWKVFEKATVGGKEAYRIGNNRQWLPAQYAALSVQQSSSNASVATNRQNVTGELIVTYYGPGQVRLLNSNGHFTSQYVRGNSRWYLYEKATINGQTMYRIGNDSQWIPAKYCSTIFGSIYDPAKEQKQENQDSSHTAHLWSRAQEQEAARDFINYINAWRATQGLRPFAQDTGWLQEGAETRGDDNLQLFNQTGETSHYRANGRDFDDAFHTNTGNLGGENIGYVGNSNGQTPKQAAERIAINIINEGPTGGHYAVIHAGYGAHPLIGVAFRSTYRNGEYVYIMNMETGSNDKVDPVGVVLNLSSELHGAGWAEQWRGKTAPSLMQYVYKQGGRVHVRQSDFPTDTGMENDGRDVNGISNADLSAYEQAFVNYMKKKYNAIIE